MKLSFLVEENYEVLALFRLLIGINASMTKQMGKGLAQQKILTRLELEEREFNNLASFASFAQKAERKFPENPDNFRTAFARDRARIIHAKSFRRLAGKTQVFVAHTGDHFRTRLTHTLEVAQIARELARSLRVNEDLAEAIALAHDLGHTPFGHAGEEQLNQLVAPYGLTFEHNQQSMRLMTQLEKKYVNFSGLNLTSAVLNGLAKHKSPFDQTDLTLTKLPSLEAQIVNLADEIAYLNHDLDDGLRAKIFDHQDLAQLNLWCAAKAQVNRNLSLEAWNHRVVSSLINLLVTDLLQTTSDNLQKFQITTLAEIQKLTHPLATFSQALQKDLTVLRSFLKNNFYANQAVDQHSQRGRVIIQQIFEFLKKRPDSIPKQFLIEHSADPKIQIITDFIAGMTDKYATNFLANLTQQNLPQNSES